MAGVALWRNNVGAYDDARGQKVFYGLCPGSADLVGIVTVRRVVTDGHRVLGTIDDVHNGFGRFVAIEVKQPGKRPTDEQESFLRVVRQLGGAATWVDSVDAAVDFIRRVQRWEV